MEKILAASGKNAEAPAHGAMYTASSVKRFATSVHAFVIFSEACCNHLAA